MSKKQPRRGTRLDVFTSDKAVMSQELQQRDAQGFWRMLWHLLVLLRPFPAVFLVLLSVAEAMIVARGTL